MFLLYTIQHTEKQSKGELNFGVFFMTSHSKAIFSISVDTNHVFKKDNKGQCYSLFSHGLKSSLRLLVLSEILARCTHGTDISHNLFEQVFIGDPLESWG